MQSRLSEERRERRSRTMEGKRSKNEQTTNRNKTENIFTSNSFTFDDDMFQRNNMACATWLQCNTVRTKIRSKNLLHFLRITNIDFISFAMNSNKNGDHVLNVRVFDIMRCRLIA